MHFASTAFSHFAKQLLSNFELWKFWKYKQLWGLRPDPSCYKNKWVYHLSLTPKTTCHLVGWEASNTVRALFCTFNIKDVFKTLSKIYDEFFCKKVIAKSRYFYMNLHQRVTLPTIEYNIQIAEYKYYRYSICSQSSCRYVFMLEIINHFCSSSTK